MAKKARLLRVKRSPRYEGEGRGRNEGEGETRLIKRRPPPSANGPTAQELHAGNCCANTTTFILQPLGKRHILFNQERCCASLPPSFFLLAKESRFGFVSARIWNARWSRSFRRSNDLATELSIADVKCKRRGRERGKYRRRLFSDNLEISYRFLGIESTRDPRCNVINGRWQGVLSIAIHRHSWPWPCCDGRK